MSMNNSMSKLYYKLIIINMYIKYNYIIVVIQSGVRLSRWQSDWQPVCVCVCAWAVWPKTRPWHHVNVLKSMCLNMKIFSIFAIQMKTQRTHKPGADVRSSTCARGSPDTHHVYIMCTSAVMWGMICHIRWAHCVPSAVHNTLLAYVHACIWNHF